MLRRSSVRVNRPPRHGDLGRIREAWGIKGELSLASPPPEGAGWREIAWAGFFGRAAVGASAVRWQGMLCRGFQRGGQNVPFPPGAGRRRFRGGSRVGCATGAADMEMLGFQARPGPWGWVGWGGWGCSRFASPAGARGGRRDSRGPGGSGRGARAEGPPRMKREMVDQVYTRWLRQASLARGPRGWRLTSGSERVRGFGRPQGAPLRDRVGGGEPRAGRCSPRIRAMCSLLGWMCSVLARIWPNVFSFSGDGVHCLGSRRVESRRGRRKRAPTRGTPAGSRRRGRAAGRRVLTRVGAMCQLSGWMCPVFAGMCSPNGRMCSSFAGDVSTAWDRGGRGLRKRATTRGSGIGYPQGVPLPDTTDARSGRGYPQGALGPGTHKGHWDRVPTRGTPTASGGQRSRTCERRWGWRVWYGAALMVDAFSGERP